MAHAGLELRERRAQRKQCAIELLARDDERWRKAHHRTVCIFAEHAVLQQLFAHRARTHERGVHFDADQQTFAAHFADQWAFERAQFAQQIVAKLGCPLRKLVFKQDLDGGQTYCGRQWVATKGAAMVAWREHLHHIAAREEG